MAVRVRHHRNGDLLGGAMKRHLISALYASTCLAFIGANAPSLAASATISIDSDDIAGVVTGPNGPEAGAWVIAETDRLDTRMIKIVVGDDQGRFVLPDMPDASYNLWTRAYGRIDSDTVEAKPGNGDVALKLNAPPNEQDARKSTPPITGSR